ncbi:hypothetical protein T440DRAFT_514092 [Plenodomus tracheiphilus IPT5]|uniref:Uncharacterized protein n=1 Tax=Plenodomus tracheiphilus IPT5 TaxID=1408161 RepID=A0A6A7BIG8_9PLEO|nr:hypothetical protein T440DRAFT_514092 [Plenodomus tracheiphilus IPT5]
MRKADWASQPATNDGRGDATDLALEPADKTSPVRPNEQATHKRESRAKDPAPEYAWKYRTSTKTPQDSPQGAWDGKGLISRKPCWEFRQTANARQCVAAGNARVPSSLRHSALHLLACVCVRRASSHKLKEQQQRGGVDITGSGTNPAPCFAVRRKDGARWRKVQCKEAKSQAKYALAVLHARTIQSDGHMSWERDGQRMANQDEHVFAKSAFADGAPRVGDEPRGHYPWRARGRKKALPIACLEGAFGMGPNLGCGSLSVEVPLWELPYLAGNATVSGDDKVTFCFEQRQLEEELGGIVQ